MAQRSWHVTPERGLPGSSPREDILRDAKGLRKLHGMRQAMTGSQGVLQRLTTVGRGAYPPPSPAGPHLPPWTQISQWENMKFTKGNMDLAHFWYTNFGFQTPPPSSHPVGGSALPSRDCLATSAHRTTHPDTGA